MIEPLAMQPTRDALLRRIANLREQADELEEEAWEEGELEARLELALSAEALRKRADHFERELEGVPL